MILFYSVTTLLGGYCLFASLPRMFHIVEVAEIDRAFYFWTDALAMTIFIFLYAAVLAQSLPDPEAPK